MYIEYNIIHLLEVVKAAVALIDLENFQNLQHQSENNALRTQPVNAAVTVATPPLESSPQNVNAHKGVYFSKNSKHG